MAAIRRARGTTAMTNTPGRARGVAAGAIRKLAPARIVGPIKWGAVGLVSVSLALASGAAPATLQAQPIGQLVGVSVLEHVIPTADSWPRGIAAGPDGAVWFVEHRANKIGRITTEGQVAEYPVLAVNGAPVGIAAGPDGALWFTEASPAGNRIGRITTGGAMTEYPLPAAFSQPDAIAVGPDGALWFTEDLRRQIGRITTGGQITEYPLGADALWLEAIAAGPDGGVWFTGYDGLGSGPARPAEWTVAGTIGRISTRGEVTTYQLPDRPAGIVAGPDGALWFTGYNANQIGRITTSGEITGYPLSTPEAHPQGIAVGPDGALWFVEEGGDKLGRITTGGQIMEYALPTAKTSPVAIVAGLDGALWFTEAAAGKIGQVRLRLSPFPPTPTAFTVVTPAAPPVAATPAPVPAGPPAPHDERYFAQTGFRIDQDAFWDYFNRRGGVRLFGYPTSRTCRFRGLVTQFFQRAVLQLGPGDRVQLLNLLDYETLPVTRGYGVSLPALDPQVLVAGPTPGTPGYAGAVIEFVHAAAPNTFAGQPVNFGRTFDTTVTLADAFPAGGGDPTLLPLLNLEVWGIPTSRPQVDPANHNFIYQRFQRGVMHFDAGSGTTQGLLLADWLKAVLTGRNLPPDLEEQVAHTSTQYLRQYCPDQPQWLCRDPRGPSGLPGTDLTFAFEPQ